MNKNNLISKVFQGGEGITDLTIKNKLNVVGSVSLPADSIQIEDIKDLQTKLNTNTTDITTINTNLANYALKTDVSTTYATKTALDTNITEVSNIKTKTADITKEGVSTKIPTLWVTDVLYLTDPDD
jgi:hypothetical protein